MAAFGLLAPLTTLSAPGEITLNEVTAKQLWELGWAARGRILDSTFGDTNFPRNLPVIDSLWGGVATSIKSVNLNAETYQDAARLSARINTYIEQLAEFDGMEWGNRTISAQDIKGRALRLVIPRGSATTAQQEAIDATIKRAHNRGVDVIVTPF